MRSVVWIPLEWPGAEHLTLCEQPGAVVAESTVIGVTDGCPWRVDYRVELDGAWQMQRVWMTAGNVSRAFVHLPDDTWSDADGTALPGLCGCSEIDIAVSPFTNTLPIRRLGLPPGASAEVRVVYIDAPTLRFHPTRQRYTHLGDGRYRYEALESGFAAVITVDDDGIVREYPDLFRQYP